MSERARLIETIGEHETTLLHAFARARTSPLLGTTLTIPQLKVLIVLSARDCLTSHELAELLGVTPASVTGMVDRLVARHLVARDGDGADRRVRRVRLTGPGSDLVEQVVTAGNEQRLRLLAMLDISDLRGLAHALTALCAVAEEVLGDSEDPGPRIGPARLGGTCGVR